MKKLKQKIKELVCVLLGHSHIVTNCFGYKNCARCGDQLGDSLAGTGLPVGRHGFFQIGQSCACAECKEAFDTLTWKDKLLVETPVFPTDHE